MGGFSLWHWVVVLLVVVVVFGTRRLRGAGRDLGEAIKGFKKGMSEGDAPQGELSDQSRSGETTSQSQPNNEQIPR